MDDKNPKKIPSGGFFRNVELEMRLIFRLIKDRRVNPFLKLLPLVSLLYLVMPDVLVGPIDDAAIIWMASYFFVELCPQEVVEEHRQDLWGGIVGNGTNSDRHEDVVDAEFKDIELQADDDDINTP